MNTKKMIAVLMAALMIVFAFSACGGNVDKAREAASSAAETISGAAEQISSAIDEVMTGSDKEYVTGKGTLVVGITDFAPMDYKADDGSWTGFDAELAEAFAESLGVDVEFIEIEWDSKFLELNTKKIDCIWNGMTITDEVKLNTNVSDAYVLNKQVVIVPADKADAYADAAALAGAKVAAESGSAGASAAADAELEVIEVGAQTDALMEVAAGTADACVIDSTMAAAMTGAGTDYENLTVAFSLTDEEYGIGFRRGSDLTAEINAFIAASKADGSLQTLADKYGLSLAE